MSDTVTTDERPDLVEDDDDEQIGTQALAVGMRHPAVPVTLSELAARGSDARALAEARVTVLETLRTAAIRLTMPQDWNLYRDREGTTIAYLSDGGCERARDIIGVEIYNVSEPVRINAADGKSFMYIIRGDGRSSLTKQKVEAMEGGRSSSEDFCKDATGAHLELLVRKAARANLDGNIARELMGLRNVPLEELQSAWRGTGKDWTQCRKARGFGSQAERMGAQTSKEPNIPPPTCRVCSTDAKPVPMVYRRETANYPAFYSCPNYKQHPDQKVSIKVEDWVKQQGQPKATPANGAEPTNADLDAEIAREDARRESKGRRS